MTGRSLALVLVAVVGASLLFAEGGKNEKKFTLQKRAPLREIVDDLKSFIGGDIQVEDVVENKTIEVDIRDAGFFQALDAICKAHGAATYVKNGYDSSEVRCVLRSGIHVDFPSAFDDNYKVVVSSILRIRNLSASGTTDASQINLALFIPPSLNFGWKSGSRTVWKLSEVKDAGGNNLEIFRDDKYMPNEVVHFDGELDYKGNVSQHSFRLAGTDIPKGLKLVRGQVEITVADSVPIRLPLEIGKEVKFPEGGIVCNSIVAHEKKDDTTVWRITLTCKPVKPVTNIRQILESRVSYVTTSSEGDYLELPSRDGVMTFDAITPPLGEQPKEIILTIRRGERTITVPFEFNDVKFEDKK